MNVRRRLLVALGASVLGAPLAAFAQPANKPVVVGVIRYGDQQGSSINVTAFKQGMEALGYIEGKNLTLELRFADGKADRLAEIAGELVRLNVDVILAMDTPSTLAAQRATRVVPIIFGTSTDPVGSGLVASLARPGGNTTGFSNMSGDVSHKYLQLLVELVPKISRVAVLLNPANSGTRAELKSIEDANKRAGLKLLPLETETAEQIERAFATMARQRVEGVLIANDAFFSQQRNQIAGLALKNRIACLGSSRTLAEAGYLLTYGPVSGDRYRRVASVVDKILKGAKPADLPVEQPTKFELYINGKTAKALGLKIPQSLLIMADKVIE